MNTHDRLAKILLKTYKMDPATLTPGSTLEQHGVDSLGVGLLLFDVEDEFGLKFTRDSGCLHTLSDVTRYIDEIALEQNAEPTLQPSTSTPVS